MRIRTVMAAAVSTLLVSCVADDFVTVEQPAPRSSRAVPADPAETGSRPMRPPAATTPDPSTRLPTAHDAANGAAEAAPPKVTDTAPRPLPEDLEPLFIAAAREQPRGERTVELVVVASERMRDAPHYAQTIGDRLVPICRELYFSDAIVAGMERLGLRRHAVKKGESPWKIARALAIDPALVARLNPTAEPTHLRIGQRLKVLDLAAADLEIVIDLGAHRLALYRLPSDGGGAQLLLYAPVGHGAASTPTPIGVTRVERIVVDPLFVDKKTNTSHGPLDPKNPWGRARIVLAADPLDVERCEIHGRPGREPSEYAGKPVTDGDVWMKNEDLALLVECLRVGARVRIE